MSKVTLAKIVDTKPASRKPAPAAPTAPAMTAAQLSDRIAKLAADVTSFRANTRVDDAFVALAKGDVKQASELIRDPETYEAYRARIAGERYEAPITKAEPNPSRHVLTIKKHLEAGDHEELRRLFHSDQAAYDTYQQMMASGLAQTYAATGIEKRRHEPPKGKPTDAWKRRILAAFKAKDSERLRAMREGRDPDFIATWAFLVAEGQIKPVQ